MREKNFATAPPAAALFLPNGGEGKGLLTACMHACLSVGRSGKDSFWTVSRNLDACSREIIHGKQTILSLS